ncbi:MAG: hypothetical protein Q9187_004512 [Circinaria calcarea]
MAGPAPPQSVPPESALGLGVSDCPMETHPHTTSVLPYVDRATAPPAIQAAFDLIPFRRHILELFANAESQFPPIAELLASFFSSETRELSDLEWLEIAMYTAVLCGSPYVFKINSQIALGRNIQPEKLILIQFGQFENTNFWTTRERTLMKCVEMLVKTHTVSDAFLATLKASFTPREIVEVVIMVGVYSMNSYLGNLARIDFDADQGPT